MPRQQVPNILQDRVRGRESLQPTAAPTNTFFPANLPAPVLQEAIDLAPLSQTLANIAGAHAAVDRQERNQNLLGAARDQENLEAAFREGIPATRVRRRMDKFRKGEPGGLDETESPYHYLGGKQILGRYLGRKYADLMAAQFEAMTQVNTGVREGVQGGPVLSYQEAREQVLKELQASPAFQDATVAAEFNTAILDIDGRLSTTVQKAYQENHRTFLKNGLLQEASDTFLRLGEDGWQPEDLTAIQDWTKHITKDSPMVFDGREVLMDGVAAAASSLSREGRNDDAVALLENFGKLEIAGVAMARNAAIFRGSQTYAEELTRLTLQYVDEAERDKRKADQEYQEESIRSERKARVMYVTAINEALAENPNANPSSVVAGLSEQFLTELGDDFGNLAIAAARDYAITTRDRQRSDPDVLREFYELVSDGNLEAADALVAASGTSLRPEDYGKALETLEDANKAQENLEANPAYKRGTNNLRRLHDAAIYNNASLRTKAGSQHLTAVEAALQERDRIALELSVAADTPEGQAALKEHLVSSEAAIKELIQTSSEALQSENDAAQAKVTVALNTLQDIRPILAEVGDALTDEQKAGFLVRNDVNITQTLEGYRNSPEFREGLRELEELFKEQPIPGLGSGRSPENVLDFREIRAEYYAAFNEKLSELLKTSEPTMRTAKAVLPAAAYAFDTVAAARGLQKAPADDATETPTEATAAAPEEPEADPVAQSAAAVKARVEDPSALDTPEALPGVTPRLRKAFVDVQKIRSGQLRPTSSSPIFNLRRSLDASKARYDPIDSPQVVERYLDREIARQVDAAIETGDKASMTRAVALKGFTPDEVLAGRTEFTRPMPALQLRYEGTGLRGGRPFGPEELEPLEGIEDRFPAVSDDARRIQANAKQLISALNNKADGRTNQTRVTQSQQLGLPETTGKPFEGILEDLPEKSLRRLLTAERTKLQRLLSTQRTPTYVSAPRLNRYDSTDYAIRNPFDLPVEHRLVWESEHGHQPTMRKRLQEAQALVVSQLQSGRPLNGRYKALAEDIQKIADYVIPVTVPVTAGDYNPLTDIRFESVEQLNSWRADEEKWTDLLEAAGIDQEQSDNFFTFMQIRLEQDGA